MYTPLTFEAFDYSSQNLPMESFQSSPSPPVRVYFFFIFELFLFIKKIDTYVY